MKITGTRGPKAARPAKEARPSSAPGPTSRTPVVDEISIAGIPESELTPRVRETLMKLMEEVRALRAELQSARAEMRDLRTLAETDPLLGVLNRRAFVRELNRALAMVERYGAPASLVFIDLNDLKTINDDLGHKAGDAALDFVARTLSANIRQTDVLGRLGGDEFGLILVHADAGVAKSKADGLAALVADAEVDLGPAARRLSIACGVVELRRHVSAEDALNEADAQMYAVKRRGGTE